MKIQKVATAIPHTFLIFPATSQSFVSLLILSVNRGTHGRKRANWDICLITFTSRTFVHQLRITKKIEQTTGFRTCIPLFTDGNNSHFKTKKHKKPRKYLFSPVFPGFYPLLELGVFFVVLNYFCLSFVQIHAHFTSITSFIMAC